MSSGLQFIPEGREAVYDGVRLDTMVFPSSSVKCVADLKFDKSDILLAGYPKTGRVYQLQKQQQYNYMRCVLLRFSIKIV